MASLRPLTLATLLVLLAASVVRVAAAAEPEAPGLVAEGVDLRRHGRDAEALAVLERALAADPSPRTRAQVALAEQALGLWVEAERDLSAALAAGEGQWFDEHRGSLALAQAFVQEHLGWLDVRASVPGAEVRVDGQLVGTTPLPPFRVSAGSLVLEVGAPGYALETRTVSMASKATEVEDVVLTETQAPARVPSPTVSGARSMQDRGAPGSSSAPSALPWLALGSSAALGAGAAVALLVRNSNAALFDDDARCFFGGPTRDQRCGAYRDAASTAQTLMIVGFAAAAVGAVGSVALFSVQASGQSGSARRVGAVCGVGVEVWCRGSF